MRIHVRRLLLLLSITALIAAGFGLFATWRLSDRQQALRMEEEVVSLLQTQDFGAASLAADRLLLLAPQSGQAHYLKAMAIFAGKPVHGIATSDSDGIAAIRLLLRASKLNPDHAPSHQLLVQYFLSVGDSNEAANHAKGVLQQEPGDLDAHFARARWRLEQSQPLMATSHVELLWEKENPLRPRTAWLAAQLADFAGKRSEWYGRVETAWESMHANRETWTTGQDLLGLLELGIWHARRSTNLELRKDLISQTVATLHPLIESPAFHEVPPRQILRAIDRLSTLDSVPVTTADKLESYVEQVFRKATDADILDPAIHIHFANRLYARGKHGEAVQVVTQGIERSKQHGAQVRWMFAACDLWLAEYHLLGRRGEEAKPYLEFLTQLDAFRPWARLMTGYQLMMEGELASAAPALSEAAVAMPKNGAAQALYGLCQLKRGLISEGRALLEEGIRLGATEPRYQAWLALALAEAGYHDQAVVVARQLIADPVRQGLGRALLGQLKLRSGQIADAERDFAEAIALAPPEARPALRLSLAEIAAERGDWQTVDATAQELSGSPLAPQALAIQYRALLNQGKTAEADDLLEKAVSDHPQSMILLTLRVQQLVQKKDFQAAIELLESRAVVDSQVLTPTLLLVEVQELAGDSQRAIETLKQASASHPEESSLQLRLAERYLAAGDLDQAESIATVLAKTPLAGKSAVQGLRARIAAEREDYAKAEEILTQAATEDPDNPMLKFLLGQLAARNGRYSSAAALFEKSLANGPLWNHASKALFHSLLYTGETDKAIDVLGQVGKRGKPTLSMRRRLIEVLAQQDRPQELDRELQAILRSRPSEQDFGILVAILQSTGHSGRAFGLLKEAQTQFPESQLLREHQVALLIESGQLDEAQDHLDRLFASDDSNPLYHAWKVEILLRSPGESVDRERMNREAEQAASNGWEKCPGDLMLAALYVQSLLRQDREEEAREFLDQARQTHAKIPDTDYLVARMHEANGDLQKAADLLHHLAIDRQDNLAKRHWIRLQNMMGLADQWQRSAEELLQSDPTDVHVLGMLAEHAATSGDFSAAEKYLEQIPSASQGGATASYVRAVIAFEKGDLATAEQRLQRSLADSRQYIPATLLLARIRAAAEQHAEVVRLTEQVRRRDPSLAAPIHLAASSLIKLQRRDEAEELCRRYLQQFPGQRRVELTLANVLLHENATTAQRFEAATYARTALNEETLDDREYEAWLTVLLQAGDRKDARERVAAVLQGAPGSDRAHAAGRAYFQAQDYLAAATIAKTLLESRPDDVAAMLLLADATAHRAEQLAPAERQAAFQESADLYRKVLKADRNNIAAANNLAWTVGMRLGDPRQALDLLSASIPETKNPRAPLPADLLDTVGTLHLQMDHLVEARSFLEAAIEKNPNSVSSHFHLGMLHSKQNRAELAKQSFAKVLAIEPDGVWARQIRESRLAN